MRSLIDTTFIMHQSATSKLIDQQKVMDIEKKKTLSLML